MNWVRLFHRYILRDLTGKPVRTLLTVAGVALGMGVVWAVHLSNERSITSFTDSVQLLNGRADFQIQGNGVPLDEQLLARLGWLWEVGALSALVEGRVKLPDGSSVPVYGIDLLSEAPFRSYLASDSRRALANVTRADFLRLLSRPDQLILPGRLAGRLEVKKGDSMVLLAGERQRNFQVAALLEAEGAAGAFGGNVVFLDIAAAQILLERIGTLDRIDVLVEEGADREAVLRRLQRELPEAASVWRPEDVTAQSRRMLRAFRFNLTALSYLSLIVGVILVYNTLNIAVVRRQREIAALRTLGASRRAVIGMFLVEAAGLGLLGALAGLAVGGLLAGAAESLVGRTVETLYTGLDTLAAERPFDWPFAGFVVGLGALLGAASGIYPARRATARPPVQVLREGFLEPSRLRRYRVQTRLGAAALAAAGVTALGPPVAGLPLWGYASALLAMAGFALLAPRAALLPLDWLARQRGRLPVEARLALQSVRGGLSRLVVAIVSLMIAVSMLVGVASMVGSFRETVRAWLDQTLVADLYVRAAGAGANDGFNPIRAETLEALSRTPGVAALGAFHGRRIVLGGFPVTLAGGDFEVLARRGRLLFVDGRDTAEVARALIGQDRVVVSEPLALRQGVRAGDVLELPAPRGPVPFRVEAVYYDYSSDRGLIVMDRGRYRELYGEDGATSVSVYLEAGADPRRTTERMLAGAGEARLQIYPNAQLRSRALQVFDQTFQVTYALEVIAVIVAVLGITNTLGALLVERRGELALLEFLGADRRQLRRMVLWESGLVGVLGTVAGTLLGAFLAVLLIYVINRQSFGWTLQPDLPAVTLGVALALVLLSTLVAGLYPAMLAASTDPIRSLRTE